MTSARRCLPTLLGLTFVACNAASSAPSDLAPRPGPAPKPPDMAEPPPPEWGAWRKMPRVDVHTHIESGAMARAVKLLGDHGISHLINLSGGRNHRGLEETVAEARASGHAHVFCNPNFLEARAGGKYGERLAKQLVEDQKLGAIGVKISKGLGLGWQDATGGLLTVDDRGLDAMFAQAGKLGLPIAIHTGDPQAFWQPMGPANERMDELRVHPQWSFFGHPKSWADLYGQFERRVTRSKGTKFIGVHFGNDPEEPDRVASMLDKHPNLYVDTAARIPEIGRSDARHDPVKMRAFFERYQDRILLGTDVGVGSAPEDLMLGSMGADPPRPPDVERFFASSWRWFETADRDIPSPTPIQGRWNVHGINLPPEILEKVYCGNAVKLLKLPGVACH